MKKFYMMCTDSATRAVRRSKGSSRLYPVHPWGLSEELFVESEVGAAFADRFLSLCSLEITTKGADLALACDPSV